MRYLLVFAVAWAGSCTSDEEKVEEPIEQGLESEQQEEVEEEPEAPAEPPRTLETPERAPEPPPQPAAAVKADPAQVTLDCQLDSSLPAEAGQVGWGCIARNPDGRPYGMVPGRWELRNGAGRRVPAKKIAFRVNKYDVVFYILQKDNDTSIQAKRK